MRPADELFATIERHGVIGLEGEAYLAARNGVAAAPEFQMSV
jgi:hypothetical protein